MFDFDISLFRFLGKITSFAAGRDHHCPLLWSVFLPSFALLLHLTRGFNFLYIYIVFRPPFLPQMSVALTDSQRSSKKQKRYPSFDLSDDMTFFSRPSSASTRFLIAPPAPIHKQRQRPRDDLDDFLSSDLELSFASTVSLHSPPRNAAVLTPDCGFAEPMDISPVPRPPVFIRPGKDDAVKTRPRAFTSAARMFGRDMSNTVAPTPQLPPPPKTGSINVKRTHRAALPMEWLTATQASEPKQNESTSLVSYFDLNQVHRVY